MVQHLDLETTNNVQQPLLPLPGRAAIYTRVAASQERQTRQAQTTDLVALVCENGFSAQQIMVYEESNVSGRTPFSRRPALSKLLDDITEPPSETEPIKAIFVSSEDRLFSDADGVEVSTFMETCIQHGVLLITPTSEYDFTNPAHVALFRFRCEAGKYAEHMRTSRLQAGKHKRQMQQQKQQM